MKHSWKKFISGVLAASMVLSMLGTGVLAAEDNDVALAAASTWTAAEHSDFAVSGNITSTVGSYTLNFAKNGSSSSVTTAIGGTALVGKFKLTVDLEKSDTITVSYNVTNSGGGKLESGKTVTLGDVTVTTTADDAVPSSIEYTATAGGTCELSGNGYLAVYSISIEPGADHVHKLTKVEAKAATCAEAGNNEYYTCTCGKVFKDAEATKETTVADETLAKLTTHSYVPVEAVPATCITPGSEAGQKCSVCGDVTGCGVIPATGNHVWDADGNCTTEGCTATNPDLCNHTYETVTPKAATCTEDGVVGGQYCTKCHDGEVAAKTVIKATGHDWQANGTCANCGESKSSTFIAAAGDLETAYALWPIEAGVSKYEAYIIDSSNKETQVDDQLIRQYPNYMRVDVLGLKAGSYKIKIVADGNTATAMTTSTLAVKAHDRSGFAFVNGTGSGAYNDDGTLKSNAEVVYVTTDAELAALLSSASIWSGKDVTKPTCVRVIGHVKASDVFGFQDWTSGLTIEGVGNDATLTGGGVFVKGSTNVEVRNLGVFHVHSGGKNDLIAIEQTNSHIWVHNCDLFYGFAGGGDQAKGDGSLDVKDAEYCTFSYNHFWDSGKCSLLGNSSTEDYITYHHNWFDHSDSRHPRTRSGNVHVYNNFYDTVAKYGVGATSGCGPCSIFVEGNYFYNTKYPMLNALQGSDAADTSFSGNGPAFIKAWNNVMVGSKSFISQVNDPDSFDAYVASSRDEQIPSSVKAGSATYSNFDTSANLGVTADKIQSPAEAMVSVTEWAGRVQGGDIQWVFDEVSQNWSSGDKIAAGVIEELATKLNNYKTSLVKVGGTVDTAKVDTTEHTHVAGTWTTTTAPTCTEAGVETQLCIICGEVMKTQKVDPAHANDGSGKCQICGKTVANGDGPAISASSKVLKYDKFKMTDVSTDGKKSAFVANEVEDATEGYFHVTGNVVKRNANGGTASAIEGTKAEFFELPKSDTSGFSFTVTDAPATIGVSWGTPKDDDSQKVTVAIRKADGTALLSETKGGKNNSSTLEVTEAGTYWVTSAADSPYSARIFSITVTEAESETPSDPVAVTGVTLSKTTAEVSVGGTVTLTATVAPSNATNKAVTWTSSNTAVATVANGKVTGVKAGTATITVKTTDGNKTATCAVTVKAAAVTPVAVTGVSLSASKLTLWADGDGAKEATLTATVAPSNADNKNVTWSSSAPGVATVANGKVTAVAAGNATITVTTADGGKTATCAVTVKTTTAGGTETGHTLLIADVVSGLGSNPSTGWSSTKIEYTADPLTNQGNDGFFTIYPKNSGSADKESKFESTKKTFDDGDLTDRVNFGGAASVGETGTAVNSIGFTTSGPATVKVWWIGGNSSESRHLTILDSEGNGVVDSAEAITNASPTISTMTLTAAGTYYLGGKENNNNIYKVVVTEKSGDTGEVEKPVTGVSLDKSTLALDVNGTKTEQLTATVTPADAADKSVSWTTSDAAVATVDQTGKVTAVAAGSATITVTTTDGGKMASCAVTVTAKSEGGNGGGGGGGGGSSSSSSNKTEEPKDDTQQTQTVFPFVDVPETHWGRSTVEKMFQKGLITGTDATHFSPSMTTSRAMVATIIWRMAGEPKVDTAADFPDVAEGAWYTDAVAWAASVGVVNGYDNGNFGPMDDVTREQVALMLSRYAALGKEDTTPAAGEDGVLADFADEAAVDNWASEAMSWAVNAGIITGREGKLLAPAADASRAEFCTMAIRFLELDETEAAK